MSGRFPTQRSRIRPRNVFCALLPIGVLACLVLLACLLLARASSRFFSDRPDQPFRRLRGPAHYHPRRGHCLPGHFTGPVLPRPNRSVSVCGFFPVKVETAKLKILPEAMRLVRLTPVGINIRPAQGQIQWAYCVERGLSRSFSRLCPKNCNRLRRKNVFRADRDNLRRVMCSVRYPVPTGCRRRHPARHQGTATRTDPGQSSRICHRYWSVARAQCRPPTRAGRRSAGRHSP